MSYIDGFVVPVPKDNLAAYKKLARKAGKIWREHGALADVECDAVRRPADDLRRVQVDAREVSRAAHRPAATSAACRRCKALCTPGSRPISSAVWGRR